MRHKLQHDLETAVFEFMEKYDEDYDRALDRYIKRQRLFELASDRTKAHELKAKITNEKRQALKTIIDCD